MKGFTFPTRELVSQQASSEIESAHIPRSRFLGAWTHKTTFDAGQLVPFLLDEILPGDHMKYDVTAYVRMSTPLFPLFDDQRVDTFFFFVPNRLVWANWAKFMGEQLTPGSSIAYQIPRLDYSPGGYGSGNLQDHFGIPPDMNGNAIGEIFVSALPFRAYHLIYKEWFRDQNTQGVAASLVDDGPDASGQPLAIRNKTHDYFTSCLPWPQKFTAPFVPSGGGQAPVFGIGFSPGGNSNLGPLAVRETQGGVVNYAVYRDFSSGGMAAEMTSNVAANDYPNIFADLSLATGGGMSINDFRQAMMVQGLLERDARGGTRYTELVKSHFGVTSPDMRLQRPEYIGGGSSPMQLSPIAQTAPTAGVPLGAIGAAGTSVGQHSASFAATEHGYVIGLINVKTEQSYQQGVHKMFSRKTRFDFYWPALAGLGEQAVLMQEIYAVGTKALDEVVFGYQERWQEYRTRYNEVTAVFRSRHALTLDAWHLSTELTAPPALGPFLPDTPPMPRVLAAGDLAYGQMYLANILVRREAVRPIPMFGTPALLGRF